MLLVVVCVSQTSAAVPLNAPCTPGAAYQAACDVDQNNVINITEIEQAAGHWIQAGVFSSGWDLTSNAGTNPATKSCRTWRTTLPTTRVAAFKAITLTTTTLVSNSAGAVTNVSPLAGDPCAGSAGIRQRTMGGRDCHLPSAGQFRQLPGEHRIVATTCTDGEFTLLTPLQPCVDFNGSGLVDAQDIMRAATYWNNPAAYDPAYDVAPPFGSPIDIFDIIAIAEQWNLACQ